MFFKKKKSAHVAASRAARRAQSLSTPELLGWLDTTAMTLGAQVDVFRRSPSKATAHEVSSGAEAFAALAQELAARQTD